MYFHASGQSEEDLRRTRDGWGVYTMAASASPSRCHRTKILEPEDRNAASRISSTHHVAQFRDTRILRDGTSHGVKIQPL